MSIFTSKWINLKDCPYEGFSSSKGTLRIGRASLNKRRSREVKDPKNIFLNNPVISATHVEFYKTSSNDSLCLINKSKNGFFLIDEYKETISYINGKDNSEYLKNGNIIALCFSKKYLKDFQEENVIGDKILATLKECKILIQIYTDYDNGLIANIFSFKNYTFNKRKQLKNALLLASDGKNEKIINSINKIFKKVDEEQYDYCKCKVNDENYFYNSEVNSSNSYIDEVYQDDIFDTRLEKTNNEDADFKEFGEFYDYFSESDSNTKYSTDFEERNDSTKEDKNNDGYNITQLDNSHLNVQKYESNNGNMDKKSTKRSYDESNCSDERDYEANQTKIRKLSSLCDSKTLEIEELKEKIEELAKCKNFAKSAALGFLSGVATTIVALYHIGSKK